MKTNIHTVNCLLSNLQNVTLVTMSTLATSTNDCEAAAIIIDIDIASEVNIHSCSVYKLIQDIPYEIPVEIIATISKYYLSVEIFSRYI